MGRITELTRREICQLVQNDWFGRLGHAEFLARLYDLEALPSEDRRFPTMLGDIQQHTVANDDWSGDWVFRDGRLGLDDDDALLRFLAETLHPVVVDSKLDVPARLRALNDLLLPDGFELYRNGSMSGRPTFAARATTARTAPQGPFRDSLISRIGNTIAGALSHTALDSLFEELDFPRPRQTGSNKVDKVKAWLRSASDEPGFDRWAGLGKVLERFFESDISSGTIFEEAKAKLHEHLESLGLYYLPGGLLTTSPPTTNQVPSTAPPAITDWQKIGEGGFGVAYKIHDARLDLDFAIKVFDPSPFNNEKDGRQRFLREAGLLFRLNHEFIIRVFDAGELPDRRPFIRMEYFPGLPLDKLTTARALPTEACVGILGRLAKALDHAHGRGIVHRDLKPSNVLVTEDLQDIRLIDFGLGILVEEAVNRSRLTTSSQHFGNAFAAPQLLADARAHDPANDIYSLGAIWYYLLVGRAPHGVGIEGSITESSIPAELKKLLLACLSARADGRPSAAEIRRRLREYWLKNQKGTP